MRRSALPLLAAGTALVVCSLAPVVSATDAEPGSALGAFSLSASAPAVQVKQEEPSYCYGTEAGQNGCELVLPEATSNLSRGPLGKAVAAVVWPGALAADIGNLLITASNGQVPDSARTLNDPVRAEAQTGSGPDRVTYDQVPGSSMVATAKDTGTTAAASVSQTQVTPLGSFGKTNGASSTVLEGAAKAVATAHSSVQDVDLAAGVIHVGAVTSDAVATTDGVKATVKGATSVSGVTIAGVPVTVDEKGFTVQGSSLDLGAASAAVNTAVGQLGIIMRLSEPQGRPQGSAVTYNAGSLVILWEQMDGFTATVALGGANVMVDADPAQDFSTPETPTTPVDPGSTPVDPGTGGSVPPVGTGTSTPSLPEVSGPGEAPVVDQAPTGGTEQPVLAGRTVPLPEGLNPWLATTAVLGSGLVMAGLRRLPDKVLVPTVPECLLEES